MEIDLFLLLFVVLTIVAAVACNMKLLMFYQAPESSAFAQSVGVKAVIVSSLTLAWMVVLLLPVDVRNSRPKKGILDMELWWSVAFVTLAVFLVIIVPASMFYHEAHSDLVIKRPGRRTLCNLMLLFFFVSCFVSISYAFLAEAELPIREYACDQWMDAWEDSDAVNMESSVCSQAEDVTLKLKVGFSIYLIAVMCFFGWIFFVVFGGIGLTAVPLDLILSFIDRPRPVDMSTYEQRKRLIGEAATALLAQTELLQNRDTELAGTTGWRASRQKRALATDYNKFKINATMLEDQFEQLQLAKFEGGGSIFIWIAKLTVGIFCAILSILWILHILIYIIVGQFGLPSTTFLNAIFTAFESGGLFPIGVALFGVFNLYLLLCVVKGCLKFGMRVFFLFSIHPMRYKSTPLNSILFNVLVVLISSGAITQFSQLAFAEYARSTDAEVIFSAQIRRLSIYKPFFENNVFVYLLLGWFLLSLIYLLVRPRDAPVFRLGDEKAKTQLESIASRGAVGSKKSGGGSWWRRKKKPEEEQVEAQPGQGV